MKLKPVKKLCNKICKNLIVILTIHCKQNYYTNTIRTKFYLAAMWIIPFLIVTVLPRTMFFEWKGDLEQEDDVCVMGIKI